MRFVAATLLLMALALPANAAEKRLALVVGAQEYSVTGFPKLKRPEQDADLVASALRGQGFDVLPPLKNPNRDQMLSALEALRGKLDSAAKLDGSGTGALGFLYFAGHGYSDERGNWLATVEGKAEPLGSVLQLLRDKAQHPLIVVLDACRTVRQGEQMRGLQAVDVRHRGLYIAYATAPGAIAQDDGRYAEELASAIKAGGELDKIFRTVGMAIEKLRRQVPYREASLNEDIWFGPKPSGWAERLPPGTTFRTCASCPEMVVVKGGQFDRGVDGDPTLSPRHTVDLANFAVGKAPVTVEQYNACVKARICAQPFREGPPGDAVLNVSWNDAQIFARWLSEPRNGEPRRRYRLLSESEWEYAAVKKLINKPAALEWTQDTWNATYGGAPRFGEPWTDGPRAALRVVRGGGSITKRISEVVTRRDRANLTFRVATDDIGR